LRWAVDDHTHDDRYLTQAQASAQIAAASAAVVDPGVTPTVVASGTHTIGVGAECYQRSNYTGGYADTAVTSSSVVVIP